MQYTKLNNRPFAAITSLKHNHLKCIKHMYCWGAFRAFKSIQLAVKERWKWPFKSLKGFKLQRTSNLTFSKASLELHTKKHWLHLYLRSIEYVTNAYQKYFCKFRINQISFTYGERKKEQPTYTEPSANISQFLWLLLSYWK